MGFGTSIYGAAKYGEATYEVGEVKTPKKSSSFTIGSSPKGIPDAPFRDNDSFFKTEKGDRTFPDKLIKTHGAEGEATDTHITPLLPTLKRNVDNKLANHLEKTELHNKTIGIDTSMKKQIGWEGKLL